MKKIITSDIPHIIALEHIYKTSTENFVIVDSMKEWIIVNKELEHVDEIIDLIKKIMQSKYLPEKLFDKFLSLTDEKSEDILSRIYSDWRKARNERDLHNQAVSLLKQAKSLRISWKVKRNKEIIKELYEIGFGLYDDKATCNSQKGAENAFMYGYLLGIQDKTKNAHCCQ